MQLQHTFTVPLGVDDAWAAFNDIEGIAPCLPGATITSVAGDEFTGGAKVKLGPISLQYTGKGRWASRDAVAYRAVIEASGKDKRGNGTAAATITAQLEPEGTGTRVVVDTDLRITGRPAQFGRGVIEDVGGKLLDQFAACLAERLSGAAAAATPAEVTGDASPAGGAQGGAAGSPAAPDAQPELVAAMGGGAGPDGGAGSDGGAGPDGSSRPAEDPTPPDVPVGDAAGEPGGPSVAIEAADVPDVPTSPPGSAPAATSAPAAELDLGNVLGPVLLRRFGPTALAVVVTAVITWVVARRRS